MNLSEFIVFWKFGIENIEKVKIVENVRARIISQTNPYNSWALNE